MNSPVSCLPDPIQNMVKRNNKKKTKKKTKMVIRRRPFALQPGTYGGPSGQTVTVPAAMGGQRGRRNIFPLTRGMGGNMRVANFEQIVAITGSNGSFSAGGLVVNPGLATNFTWLGAVASNYQTFKFHYLRFIYVPACPTTTNGTAFVYLDYNFNSSEPTSLAQVDLTPYSSSGPAWLGGPVDAPTAFAPALDVRQNIHVDVDCAKFTQPWYNIRTSSNANVSSGGSLGGTIPDGLTFTPGAVADPSGRPCTIYWGSNTNTSSVIGLLYACYDVEFNDPISAALNT